MGAGRAKNVDGERDRDERDEDERDGFRRGELKKRPMRQLGQMRRSIR